MRKLNHKAFSLIELIGVITIIGLILLVVFPVVIGLTKKNTSKEYDSYYDLIEKGALAYAETRVDDLGKNGDVGCINKTTSGANLTLNELIAGKYVTKFRDPKITCTADIQVRNNLGKYEAYITMTCKDNTGATVYGTGSKHNPKKINTALACGSYGSFDDRTIREALLDSTKIGSGYYDKSDSGQTFIYGSNPNNYVWYSGKLWRAVSVNGTYVKLITNDVITTIRSNSSAYNGSSADTWLTNVFLPELKDPDTYLYNGIWDVAAQSTLSGTKPNSGTTVVRKVGLLNSYEAYKAYAGYGSSSYLNVPNATWRTSNTNGSSAYWTFNGSGLSSTLSYTNYAAIRPVVNLNAHINIVSGSGTAASPYRLEGDSGIINEGTLLNTRHSGEYVSINGVRYRIVDINDKMTKVIMEGFISTSTTRIFDTEYYHYSTSDLYNYLKNTWYGGMPATPKSLIYPDSSWCPKDVTTSYVAPSNSCSVSSVTSPVGLPTIGDIFTSNFMYSAYSYWVINPYSTSSYTINYVTNANSVSSDSISSSYYIKPVIYLKSNVAISSGSGMVTYNSSGTIQINSPFQLYLK